MTIDLATVWHRHAGLIRGAAASVVVVAALLLGGTGSVERPLAWLPTWVEALGAGGPVLLGMLFVAATLLLAPATPVTIAAGAMLGPVVGTVVILLGAVASSAIAFLLSRRFAHQRLAAGLSGQPRLVRVFYRAVERGGWKVVVAIRFSHALPFGLQNYLFGLTPVGIVPFLLASAGAMFPGTAVYVYLGHLGAMTLECAQSAVGIQMWVVRGLGLVAAAAALAYVAHTAREMLREEADVDLDEVKSTVHSVGR